MMCGVESHGRSSDADTPLVGYHHLQPSGRSHFMSKNKEATSKRAASQASKTLRDPKSTPAEKTAAASDLSQRAAAVKETSAHAASKASQVLKDPNASAAAKSAAGSALTQTRDKKKH
jgi:hypothetical protein